MFPQLKLIRNIPSFQTELTTLDTITMLEIREVTELDYLFQYSQTSGYEAVFKNTIFKKKCK